MKRLTQIYSYLFIFVLLALYISFWRSIGFKLEIGIMIMFSGPILFIMLILILRVIRRH